MLKKFCQHFCFLLALLVCFACTPMVSAAEHDPANLISVDGSGRVTAAPDKAVVTVSVMNFAQDAAEAQQENARRTTALLDALKAAGVAASDLETCSYSFSPAHEEQEQENVAGYRVQNCIRVTVRAMNTVGAVIDTALANGANRVSGLNFSLAHPEALRKAAIKQAVADARLKADMLAEALGVHISGIRLVTENVGSVYERDAMPMLMANRAGQGGLVSTPIAANDVEVSASVHIDYIIS